MRTLVLGGTAWLGRGIAEASLAAGHDVTCVARGSAPFPAGVTPVTHDRTQPLPPLGRFDLVVDVATDPAQIDSTIATHRYVFVSTASVYADHSAVGADEKAATIEADGPPPVDYGWRKVQAERLVAQAFPVHLRARSGLIGGPGDHTGRTTYWPWRFTRDLDAPVLVPVDLEQPTQLIDVRDLARWLVTTDATGVVDAVGPVLTLGEHLQVAREAVGHRGPLVPAEAEWLQAQGVEEWAGERSLPLWLADPGWRGFAARAGTRARATGLTTRPLHETLVDGLASLGDGLPGSGLSDDDHAALLAAIAPR